MITYFTFELGSGLTAAPKTRPFLSHQHNQKESQQVLCGMQNPQWYRFSLTNTVACTASSWQMGTQHLHVTQKSMKNTFLPRALPGPPAVTRGGGDGLNFHSNPASLSFAPPCAASLFAHLLSQSSCAPAISYRRLSLSALERESSHRWVPDQTSFVRTLTRHFSAAFVFRLHIAKPLYGVLVECRYIPRWVCDSLN